MRHLVRIMLALAAGLVSFQSVRAQQTGPLTVTNLGIAYEFGTYISFQAQINLPSPPADAVLLFRADGEDTTHLIPVQLDGQGNTLQRYDLSAGMVRPFSTIRYHYRINLISGEELNSDEYFFQYEDNRFTWQVFSQDEITIHWYAPDPSFGQAAVEVARRGIDKVNKLLLVSQAAPIDIYLYSSNTDQAAVLEIDGMKSVGGHPSPDLHLALVSIPSDSDPALEMDQKIPHELAHILTYDLMGDRYSRLPVWLREGIATQTELNANPDYPLVLAQAFAQDELFGIADLCVAFPPEQGRSFLAYAEADSFTRYIIDNYGQTGLLALISAYSDDLNCSQGMQQSLGKSLDQVESEWHSNVLGETPGQTAFKNLFPYLAILFMLMVVSMGSALMTKRPHNG